MDVKLLDKIATWLENGGDADLTGYEFNMEIWFDDDYEDCGTACCIAGAAVAMTKGLDYMRAADVSMKLDVEVEAQQILGLSGDVANALFIPQHTDRIWEISPYDAAKTIRHLIKYGVVDWSENKVPF